VTPVQASATLKLWFTETSGHSEAAWADSRLVLAWLEDHHAELTAKVAQRHEAGVAAKAEQLALASPAGAVAGLASALAKMGPSHKAALLAQLASLR
jgi:hypothetical protein